MLVFSTRLPLKSNVTQKECIELFIKWIVESKHYPIYDIQYDPDSQEDYECTEGNITFSIRHYTDEKVILSACRLENKESESVWINDCIFVDENNEKSLLIQLNCGTTSYETELPYINKPYIVRLFIEGNYCRNDDDIPVSDMPFIVDEKYLDKCSDIMKGSSCNIMPVVYISCNYSNKTIISPQYMAKQLSGIGHVFYELEHETAVTL